VPGRRDKAVPADTPPATPTTPLPVTQVQRPWVELRIHGVSGTAPEDMLHSAHACQVSGDEFSRFFRPCDPLRRETRPEPDHILEGYHWGKYTSGSWRQGLWLVILPFGVVNAAQFMLPTPTTKAATIWHAVAGGMLRLLGLGLTATLLLGVAVLTMDLTVWQWAPTHDLPQWAAMPGWPMAAAMAVCVGVLALLFSFGRRLGGANDRTDHRDGLSPGSGLGLTAAPADPPTELGRENFFTGDTDAPALRMLHLATGLALIAILGAAPGLGDNGADTAVFWSYWISAALLGLLVVIVVLLGDPEETVTVRTEGWTAWLRTRIHALARPVAVLFVVLAALDLGFSLWWAGRRPLTTSRADQALPGIDGVAFGVLVACVFAMLVLFVATAVLAALTRTHGSEAPPAPFARFAMGMTPALAAAIGTFLAVGYAAAMPFGWAWFLGRGGGPDYEVSPLLQRIAYAWGLTFLLMAVLGLAAGISYLRRRAEFRDRATAAYTFGEPEPTLRLPASWLGRVATGMWSARLKNAIQLVLWVFAIYGLVLSLAAGAEYFGRGEGDDRPFELPGPLDALSEDTSDGGGTLVITIGTVVLIGLAAGLLFLGRGAIRQESLRRGVNIGWDVLAFWPRAVHPFVPPPYSQRAVADLRARISWHLGDREPNSYAQTTPPEPEADHVVIAAHSQGSLIALAAVLWLPPDQRARVGLVTFGSQLKVQFPRAFPAYVNFSVLTWLYAELGQRWVNLYRDTDAIAGPVLSWGHSPDRLTATEQSYRIDQWDRRYEDVIDPITGRRVCGPEWRLLDPPPFDPKLQQGPVARIRAHSHYPDDPDWPNAVRAVFPDTSTRSAMIVSGSAGAGLHPDRS